MPWAKLRGRRSLTEELVAAVEVRPWSDLLKSPLQAEDLGRSYICESGDCVSVKRTESYLVEVDDAKLATS